MFLLPRYLDALLRSVEWHVTSVRSVLHHYPPSLLMLVNTPNNPCHWLLLGKIVLYLLQFAPNFPDTIAFH